MSFLRPSPSSSFQQKSTIKPTDPPRIDEFVSLQLGDSRHTIRVPTMPSIFAPTHDKAKCFDYFSNQILPLRFLIPPAKLISAYAAHFPVSTMSAENDARSIADLTFQQFFQISNLEGRGFFNTRGHEIVFRDCNTNDRPKGLDYFRFLSTVTPANVDARLSAEPPFTVEFDLPLPQTPALTTSTDANSIQSQPSPNHNTTAITVNLFATPNDSPFRTSTPKMYRALQHHSTDRSATSRVTYHGSLDFLDIQDAFDHIWPNPTPVYVFTQANGGVTDVTLKLRHFCSLCHL